MLKIIPHTWKDGLYLRQGPVDNERWIKCSLWVFMRSSPRVVSMSNLSWLVYWLHHTILLDLYIPESLTCGNVSCKIYPINGYLKNRNACGSQIKPDNYGAVEHACMHTDFMCVFVLVISWLSVYMLYPIISLINSFCLTSIDYGTCNCVRFTKSQ